VHIDNSKEKKKLYEIETNSTKRHVTTYGQCFLIEDNDGPLAGYKIPSIQPVLNPYIGDLKRGLDIGIIINETMEITTSAIEEIYSLESRMAMQKIRL